MASADSLTINSIALRYSIDAIFDLDEALTMNTNSSSSTSEEEEEQEQEQEKVQDKKTISELMMMVSNLPTVVATQGICMVCIMEDFQQAFTGKQLPCGHVFHATCISRWISLSDSCPLCRSSCTISGTTN